jgi:hypothetical protein
MSDQIEDARKGHQSELAGILADIARLRDELKPKHITAHVLPDGRVMLGDGNVLDGIRGAPAPGVMPVVEPPSEKHIKARVLPDGTVMVGDKIVDGIRGVPTVPANTVPIDPPVPFKDAEQDRKLASLADKGQSKAVFCDPSHLMAVAELMARTAPLPVSQPIPAATGLDDGLHVRDLHPTAIGPNTDVTREKTVIKEREVVTKGPGGRHRKHETEDVIERDYATGPGHSTGVTAISGTHPDTVLGTVPGSEPGTNVLANIPVDAAGIPLPASQPSSVGSRLNPRTGKPLSIPKPLSLSPHNMSPINPVADVLPGTQIIREEHEEVSQHFETVGSPSALMKDYSQSRWTSAHAYTHDYTDLHPSRWY